MKLSKRERVLLGVLLALLVIGTYVFYLFLPKYHQYNANRQKLYAHRVLLQDLQTLKESGEVEKEKQELLSRLDLVDKKLPSAIQLPTLYNDLLALRDLSKTTYESLDFSLEDSSDKTYDDGSSLVVVNVNVVITGTYDAIDLYLENLTTNKRKFVVDQLGYKSISSGMEATLKIRSFALVQDGEDFEEEYQWMSNQPYGKARPFE